MVKKIDRTKVSRTTKAKTSKILRGLRKASGRTLTEVADKTGINNGTIFHMEAGDRCPPHHFKRLIASYKASKKVFEALGRKSIMELGYFSVAGKSRG